MTIKTKCDLCGSQENVGKEGHDAFKNNNLYLCYECRKRFYKITNKVYPKYQYQSIYVEELLKLIKKDPWFLFIVW